MLQKHEQTIWASESTALRKRELTLRVNGEERTGLAEPRLTLADFLRDELGLTGTHLGCEHGVCGACTILVDGRSARSCLMLAVQAAGHELTTVEGLAAADGTLHPIQEAFSEKHGLQCGFCTPGFLISVKELLEEIPDPDEATIRSRLSGNLCRCTGYQNIVESVLYASELLRGTPV
ncbi:MAG TPA: (2Fe-2S)-binding protein [Gaiellaceae bacterium]|nr:(2Fe-2S)-binding protein [Gaiellaceae bacterium]